MALAHGISILALNHNDIHVVVIVIIVLVVLLIATVVGVIDNDDIAVIILSAVTYLIGLVILTTSIDIIPERTTTSPPLTLISPPPRLFCFGAGVAAGATTTALAGLFISKDSIVRGSTYGVMPTAANEETQKRAKASVNFMMMMMIGKPCLKEDQLGAK